MIPAGYMAKRVMLRDDWLRAPAVEDIYSVSRCMSGNFSDDDPDLDHARFERANGYWFLNSVEDIEELAGEHSVDLTGCRLFYYEVHELEFEREAGAWESFQPEESAETAVVPPAERRLEGYDVVTFLMQTSPECSPLSCNGLAEEIATNRHCLLESFEEAVRLLESGAFEHSEPGPCRIIAVYSVLTA